MFDPTLGTDFNHLGDFDIKSKNMKYQSNFREMDSSPVVEPAPCFSAEEGLLKDMLKENVAVVHLH